MAIPSLAQIGLSGMRVAKAGISTAGHNIANATTEGFSRQQIRVETNHGGAAQMGQLVFGNGADVARVERVNDEYLEKQMRSAGRQLASYEEREFALNQIEEVFNELDGSGLTQVMNRFFNDFRKLADQPESPALRAAVKDSAQTLVNEFKHLTQQVREIRDHVDARIASHVASMNSYAKDLVHLNEKIKYMQLNGGEANDLQDQREITVKKLNAMMDMSTVLDNSGALNIGIPGIGSYVNGTEVSPFEVVRSPADHQGKAEGSLDVMSATKSYGPVTHQIQGGRIGSLIQIRDEMIPSILDRLDTLAYGLVEEVNSIHSQGYSVTGQTGIPFFEPMAREGAAEKIQLSSEIAEDENLIATGSIPNAPGDNRVALAISNLQGQKFLDGMSSSPEDIYSSIVNDVGTSSSYNRFAISRERDIVTHLGKMRDQISGVSIDEETTRLLEYQHVFDAAAKVIQLADEMLKTILSLKRD